MDLEAVWAQREDVIYPELFGGEGRGIFPLSQNVFDVFPNAQIDPRWLHYGVFEYAPFQGRKSWLYVTSGHSNPWDTPPEDYRPDGRSGAGVEFSIETQDQAEWAISFLLKMLAFDLLVSSGQYGDKPPLGIDDRIPLGGPIDGNPETPIHAVILHSPESYPNRFQLPSGHVDILQFVGVTEAERDLARAEGFDALRNKLVAEANFPTTNVRRP